MSGVYVFLAHMSLDPKGQAGFDLRACLKNHSHCCDDLSELTVSDNPKLALTCNALESELQDLQKEPSNVTPYSAPSRESTYGGGNSLEMSEMQFIHLSRIDRARLRNDVPGLPAFAA